MNNCFALFFFLLVSFSGFAQKNTDSLIKVACSEKLYLNYLPKSSEKLEQIKHTAYVLGYSEKNEQASWVSYVLSKKECMGDESRSSTFFVDPMVKTGSAANEDYKASGYDRGHLAPAGDMGFSKKTMKESFYYSNMSPQTPSFNRGIWKELETQTRDWAKLYGSCLVITGPILKDSSALKTIGPNQVSVPNYYYKIIINPNLPTPEAIAFVLKNEDSDQVLSNFVVTIDQIEILTGLDFFPNLSADCQKKIENHVSGKVWKGMENVQISAN